MIKNLTKSGNVKAVYHGGSWTNLKKCRCNRYPNQAGGNRVSCSCGLTTKAFSCGEYQKEISASLMAWYNGNLI